jgi:hypothetical protein
MDHPMSQQMVFPAVETKISSPAELTALLRNAKRCIANGTLRQVKPNDSPFVNDDLGKVPDHGPWPDYVEAYFEDCFGHRYRLAVETYHGTGGSWGRAETNLPLMERS